MHEDDAPRVAGLDEPDEFVMARMGAEIELLPLALDVDRDAVHVDHALLDEPPPVRPFDLVAGEQDGAARVLSNLLQISEDGTAIAHAACREDHLAMALCLGVAGYVDGGNWVYCVL